MNNSIPTYAAKYFWGDDLSKLDLVLHRRYVIQNILENGDIPSIKWLFSVYEKNEIIKLLPDLKLSPKSANFWKIYLN